MDRRITHADSRFAFPPGDTIFDELQAREQTTSDLAAALNIGEEGAVLSFPANSR